MDEVARLGVVLNQIRTDYEIVDNTARADLADLEAALQTIQDQLDNHWNIGQSRVLYVSKVNSRFTTINQAIEYARTYASSSDRVTIVIASGVYNETIDLDVNPGIDFFGIGTVLLRSSVAWPLSTIRCSNEITVYNMSFENNYEIQDQEHAGYGLHADPITGNQNYFNCYFYSDNNSGAGIGMGPYGQCNFNNCRFRGLNGVYAHNYTRDGTAGQWLRFFTCNFESINTSNPCVRIADAATMAEAGRESKMGVVFTNCTANNNNVDYRYGTPLQALSYIPTSTTAYNIFLYQNSMNNALLGVNHSKQIKQIEKIFPVMGSDYWYLPETDAYKYEWTITSFQQNVRSNNAWSGWQNFPNNNYYVRVDNNNPDCITVRVPAVSTLATGERVYRLIMSGVPRRDITLPYIIHQYNP